jgi:hypothetical protein
MEQIDLTPLIEPIVIGILLAFVRWLYLFYRRALKRWPVLEEIVPIAVDAVEELSRTETGMKGQKKLHKALDMVEAMMVARGFRTLDFDEMQGLILAEVKRLRDSDTLLAKASESEISLE